MAYSSTRPRAVRLPGGDMWSPNYGKGEDTVEAPPVLEEAPLTLNQRVDKLVKDQLIDGLYHCPWSAQEFERVADFRAHLKKNFSRQLMGEAEKTQEALKATARRATKE
jgi:hypothetical protein